MGPKGLIMHASLPKVLQPGTTLVTQMSFVAWAFPSADGFVYASIQGMISWHINLLAGAQETCR